MDNELQQLMVRLDGRAQERLERMLDRTARGSEAVLQSPIYDYFRVGTSAEEMAQHFDEVVGSSGIQVIDEFDAKAKEKRGPYSQVAPSEERLPGLLEYWKQQWNPDEAALSYAVDQVKALIPPRSLRPASYSTAFSLMPTDTNLGLPKLTRDRQDANEYLRRAIQARSPEDWYPFVWFSRTTPNGLKGPPRNRDVWGADHIDTIKCARYLGPMLNALRMRFGFSGWKETHDVDVEVTNILSVAKGRRILSGDYHSFDKTLPGPLLSLADDIIATWFPAECEADIRLIGTVCATLGIVVPFTVLSGRVGGMPSGHGFTNIKDTICSLVALYYVAYRINTALERYLVLGDDFVALFRDDWDLESVETAMAELGLDVNKDKQYVDIASVTYLQRIHTIEWVRDGLSVGCHSPYRTWSGLHYYERWRPGWNRYLDSMRWIGQVEVCVNHPCFGALVQYLYHGDKVLHDEKMHPNIVMKRAGGADKIRSALGVASYPYNAKRPELVSSFETTKLIETLQA